MLLFRSPVSYNAALLLIEHGHLLSTGISNRAMAAAAPTGKTWHHHGGTATALTTANGKAKQKVATAVTDAK